VANSDYTKPYVDSSVVIAYVKGEIVLAADGHTRVDIAEQLFSRAQDGQYFIYTSALTISEVHKVKGGTELADAEDESIIEFLRNSFIKIINNDRGIGEQANRLSRKTGLMPNDAIHLASALYAGCDVLLVWDKRFEKVKHAGISIEQPRMMGQLKLMEVEKKQKK